ncbi:MAG: hypothetical protein ALECFALPRED_000784 [Alectoria fallacina]|uniref:Uncharacterized protein n=1 Tax=Alectoria fallacina TaxID=1903189 RepID=A0A8H3IFA8_9LECA|nr:MAG: hypothetical protein ALECFALPRED_000784 [Alectoria fallacina]
MATLNTKARANFEEWLENIDDNDLKLFVFANTTDEGEFRSDDFKLVHSGVSDGKPADCHIIEARINGNTKNEQTAQEVIQSHKMAG